MNLISNATLQLLTYALGWTLLHFLWQGALVALILACVLALLHHRSSQPRYFAACSALVLMTTLPIVTFALIVAQERRAAHTIITLIALDPVTAQAVAASSAPLLYRVAIALDRFMPLLLTLWFIGVLLFIGRLSMGLLIAGRMKSLATKPPNPDLLSTFHHLIHRIGISRPVILLHSALVQVPTVIGWLRPVVLIPLGCLSGFSPQQVEAILSHELAHIRRHDYLISVLQSIVEALLFYHPAVWWVSRCIRIEREHCCDDIAVQIGCNPLTYARALSLLAEQSLAQPTIALGANGGLLTMRIKRLLNPKEGPVASQLAIVTLLTIVILTVGLYIGIVAHAEDSSARNYPTQLNRPQPNAPAPSSDVSHNIANPPASQSPDQVALLSDRSSPDRGEDLTQNTQPAPTNRIRVSSGIMAGQTVSRVAPIYPPEARSAAIQGAVVLRAVISKTGDVTDLEPISGPEELRASALEAVHQWKYFPYLLNGQPQEVVTNVTINYNLPDPSASQANPPSPGFQATPGNRIRVSAGVMAGAILSRGTNPIYPPEAKSAAIQGSVVLQAVISKTGDITSLEPISGPKELRASAVDAVSQWKYRPFLLNGEPQEVSTTINVNFHLR